MTTKDEALALALESQKKLIRAYVNLLETGRDRIISHVGTCDSVEQMEASDPALREAREAITAIKQAITPETGNAATPTASAITAGNGQAPYSNCRFRICDLPGQCKGEGKCHHPAVHQAQEPVDIEYFGLEPWERDKPISPTAGMNIAQRILHVGGRNNEAGYVEFGSIQAVEALVRQVLRDLPAPKQAEPIQPSLQKTLALAQEGIDLHDYNAPEYIICAELVRLNKALSASPTPPEAA